MDTATQRLMSGAAGAGGEGLYIDEIFNITTYHGNSTSRSITTGLDMSGEGGKILTGKRSSGGGDWVSTSTETSAAMMLRPNDAAAEASFPNAFSGFTSTGYTLGTSSDVNQDGKDMMSYSLRKAEGFFDIVRYSGNGVNNRGISHSLNAEVGMMWIKKVSGGTGNWFVYHKYTKNSNSHTYYSKLNSGAPASNSGRSFGNSAPTTTQFFVDNTTDLNGSGNTYECYLFADNEEAFGKDGDASVMKMGAYMGNHGGSEQQFDLGWTPQLVIIKDVDDSEEWVWASDQGGVSPQRTYWMSSNVGGTEQTNTGSSGRVWFYNKGFIIPQNGNALTNKNGKRYIYTAIRKIDGIVGKPIEQADQALEMSFGSNGTGWPDTPYFETKNSNNSNLGFKVDTAWVKKRANGNANWQVNTRGLHAEGFGDGFNSNNGSGQNTSWSFDYMNGWNHNSSMNSDYISYMWKNHMGHESLLYKGTGSQQNVIHHLGQAPEWIIIKSFENGREWITFQSHGMGNSQWMKIDNGGVTTSSNVMFGSGAPLQADHFVVNTDQDTNQSGYIYHAQLFSSVPGISKVGTYTGTGGSHQLDLGFQPRFMVTKGKASGKNWCVQDTLNSWTSTQSNNRVLSMNDNGDGNTPPQLVSYPISTGVQFSGGTFYDHINANGVVYLYYAHA
tara:strand:- start:589 stop:2595 length:2007 start_codon:yes stop_codon:yes gene_type:complete